MQLKITKIIAFFLLIIPAGISRTAVLGFIESNSASSQRLNAIAALRAKTIHNNTNIKSSHHGLYVS